MCGLRLVGKPMTKPTSPEFFSTNLTPASGDLDDDAMRSSHEHLAQPGGDDDQDPLNSDPTGCNTSQTTTCP